MTCDGLTVSKCSPINNSEDLHMKDLNGLLPIRQACVNSMRISPQRGCSLTWMRHGDGFIRVTRPHVIDDHSGGVEARCVADFLFVCAVAFGYERDPGPVCRLRGGEPGAQVAGLSVVAGQRDEHRAPDLSFGRVLAIAAALGLLRLQLGGGRILVADVHECSVPLLLLGHGEVQTQQVHEAEG